MKVDLCSELLLESNFTIEELTTYFCYSNIIQDPNSLPDFYKQMTQIVKFAIWIWLGWALSTNESNS